MRMKTMLAATSRAISIILLMASTSVTAHAKNCEDDSIDSVSDDGDIIKLLSGNVYEIDSTDTVDTALWLPADDVLVCEEGGGIVEIVNTDENGEKAGAAWLK
jgi:hypothetical protein